MNEIQRAIDKARMKILMYEPLLGGVASRLRWPAEVFDIEMAATDGVSVRFGEKFFGLPLPVQLFIMAHEVVHNLLLHHVRVPPAAKKDEFLGNIWNVVCDAKINRSLLRSKSYKLRRIERPDCGVFDLQELGIPDDELDAATEEELYSKVVATFPQTEENEQKLEIMLGDFAGDVQSSGDDGDGDGDDGDGDGEDGDADGAKGRPQYGDDAKPLDEDDIRQIVAEVSLTARNHGDMGGLIGAEVMERLLRPKVSWRQVLIDYFQSRTHGDDPTWRRRNRRVLSTILPGREDDALPHTVIALDVSGSCHDYSEQFIAELKGITEQVQFDRLTVLFHDTDVLAHYDTEETSETPFEMVERIIEEKVPYGGGTNYEDVVRTFHDHNGEVLIWLTDMCAPQVDPDLTVPDDTLFVVPWWNTTKMSDVEDSRDYVFNGPVGRIVPMMED